MVSVVRARLRRRFRSAGGRCSPRGSRANIKRPQPQLATGTSDRLGCAAPSRLASRQTNLAAGLDAYSDRAASAAVWSEGPKGRARIPRAIADGAGLARGKLRRPI